MMMENRKVRVGITQGDTNGIGYELIFKTFGVSEMLETCTPVVYGSPKIATYHRKALGSETAFTIIEDAEDAKTGRLNMLTCFEQEVKVDLGKPTPESGKAAKDALDRAVSDLKAGKIDVLVSAPITNDNTPNDNEPFAGLPRYLQNAFGETKQGLAMLLGDELRIALMTDDVALKDVAEAITEDNIVDKATLLYNTLRRDFNLSGPRVAVLSLNPTGDGGEEENVLKPAIQKLRDNKVIAFGPFAAGDFFGRGEYDAFDGVLAMYHDQGAVPLRALRHSEGVVYYAGLPYVCTTLGCGASFSIAGQGKADADAFRQAIFTAIDAFRNRAHFDEPLANPLPKLYREKRDDTEKVRFSIPKKHENAIRERLGSKRQAPDNRQQPAAEASDSTPREESANETQAS